MIKEIIVVEGKADTIAIKRAVEAETIETGGSAIGEAVLSRIVLAKQRRGVIIFTDPDHAGERIRKIVSARVPGCKHAFLPQSEATHQGDIGVENASPESIRRALQQVRTEYVDVDELESGLQPVTWQDMMQSGLLVHDQASERRLAVGNQLGIGYANGKQFHKRCTMFRIDRAEFLEAVKNAELHIRNVEEGQSRE